MLAVGAAINSALVLRLRDGVLDELGRLHDPIVAGIQEPFRVGGPNEGAVP
jgi:hypothetical protein